MIILISLLPLKECRIVHRLGFLGYCSVVKSVILNPFQELNRERLKATAALKSLREELEDKLRIELEQKVKFGSLTMCSARNYN